MGLRTDCRTKVRAVTSYMYLHVHVLLLAGGGRGCIHVLHVVYHIARNFRGRKLLRIGEKYDFTEKTFANCLLLPCQRIPHPLILWRKFR